MNSDPATGLLPWISLGAVSATGLLATFAGNGRAGKLMGRLADGVGLGAMLLALAAWLLRWQSAGHLPLFGTYESALSLVAAIMLSAGVLRSRLRVAGGVWAAAGITSALLLVQGLQYSTAVFALTISERSLIVDLHAIVAWAALGVLTANAGLGILVLRGLGGEAARHLLIATLSLGFLMHSAMLASGSLYKFLLFGRTWSFDPIETLGLTAWLAYGTLLHMQLLAGWQGKRLARWCLFLFALLLVSYRAIVYFPAGSTYHIFDIGLRLHG